VQLNDGDRCDDLLAQPDGQPATAEVLEDREVAGPESDDLDISSRHQDIESSERQAAHLGREPSPANPKSALWMGRVRIAPCFSVR